MPFYRYKYLSPLGKVEIGNEFFDSDDSFLKEIKNRKIHLIRFKKGFLLEKYRPFLSWKSTAQTLGDLSGLINSNLSFLEASKVLQELSGPNALKRAYRQFYFLINQGISLGQAFRGAFGALFPPSIMWMLIGSSNIGKFSESLKNIHEYALWRDSLYQEQVKAYRYPLTLAIVVSALILVAMEFIAPQVYEFMGQNNIPVPAVLEFFYTKGIQINSSWVLIGLFALFLLFRVPTAKNRLIYALRKIRLLGNFLNLFLFAQFFRMVGTALKTGMNEEEVLRRLKELRQEGTLHPVLGEVAAKIHEDINKGYNLSSALKNSYLVPSYISEIVAIGEARGNLEGTCFDLSDLLKNSYQRKCQLLIAWTQVFFLIIITFMIFILAEMTVLPLYENLFKLSI